jgi:hypothetical protein
MTTASRSNKLRQIFPLALLPLPPRCWRFAVLARPFSLRFAAAAFNTNRLILLESGLILGFRRSPVLPGRGAQRGRLAGCRQRGPRRGDRRPAVCRPDRARLTLFGLLSVAGAFLTLRITREAGPDETWLAAGRKFWAAEGRSLLSLAGLALQLALIVLAMKAFRIENQVVYGSLMPIVLYAFILNVFLLHELRQPFFVFLSLAVIAGVLGIWNGVWLVGIVLAMVGLLHLPIRYAWRLALALLAGSFLAYSRQVICKRFQR